MKIQSGTGKGTELAINGRNEAKVFAISESEAQSANDLGNAYNINTGEITGITSGDASLIYFKNDEVETVIIEAIAVGLKGLTGLTDMANITVIRNPSTGDIVSDATAVAMNVNRNFGSSKTLSSTTLAYKGKNSGTFTDGDDALLLYQGNNNRLFTGINIELPRGASIGVKVDSDATGGSAYCALILHLIDGVR